MSTVPGDDAAGFAVRVAATHGASAVSVTALPGVVNHVFRVRGVSQDWVVRSPVDPRQPDEFPTEVWVSGRAAELGVAVPAVVATGHLDGRPYMVAEYCPAAGEPDPEEAWRWLGRYAAVLSRIDLDGAPETLFSRFGRDLPAAWHAHLAYNLAALSERDPLCTDGVYQREDLGRLRAMLQALAAAEFSYGLAHGDLAPRNLIGRPPPAAPVLIDWGNASTGPAPWTDLQRVYVWAVHDQTIGAGDLESFAAGAGLPIGPAVTATLRQLTALQYLDVVRWAIDQRPDLYQQYRSSSRRGLAQLLGTDE